MFKYPDVKIKSSGITWVYDKQHDSWLHIAEPDAGPGEDSLHAKALKLIKKDLAHKS